MVLNIFYKGKTTLLNVLNFRNRGDLKIKGDVKINGQVINSPTALAAISGYVQQVFFSQVYKIDLVIKYDKILIKKEDLFVGTLKVNEQLKFQVMCC